MKRFNMVLFFKRLFSFLLLFDGRVNRSQYFLYRIISLMFLILLIPLITMSTTKDSYSSWVMIFGAIFYFFIPVVLSIKRWHDLNKSGSYIFLSFVPIVSLWAAFTLFSSPGMKSENNFGAPPKSSKRRESIRIFTTIIIIVLSVCLFPTYFKKIEKKKEELRKEHINSFLLFPKKNDIVMFQDKDKLYCGLKITKVISSVVLYQVAKYCYKNEYDLSREISKSQGLHEEDEFFSGEQYEVNVKELGELNLYDIYSDDSCEHYKLD